MPEPSALDKLKTFFVDQPFAAAAEGVGSAREALTGLMAPSEEPAAPAGPTYATGDMGMAPQPQEGLEMPIEQPAVADISESELESLHRGFLLDDDPGAMKTLGDIINKNMQGLGNFPSIDTPKPPEGLDSVDALRSAAVAAEQVGADLGEMYAEMKELVSTLPLKHFREAEDERMQEYKDAQFYVTTGLPREEFDHLQGIVDVVAQNPDAGPTERRQAAEARLRIAQAQKEMEEPNPLRLWDNMAWWKQTLFIFANALGTAGRAVTGSGPTPLDVAMDLMERDYQAQKDGYKRLKENVSEARSAYAMAAQRTNNEMERAALAKNLMLSSVEMSARSAGLLQQADQIEQARAQMMTNFKIARAAHKQQAAVTAINAAVKMRIQRALMRAKTAGASKLRELPAGQAEKLGHAGSLRAEVARGKSMFAEIGLEAYSPLSYAPFIHSNAKVWDAKKERLAHAIARAAEGGRVTEQDVLRYIKGLPAAAATTEFGDALFDEMHGEGVSKLASVLVEFRAANYNVVDQYKNFVENYGVTPEKFLAERTAALRAGEDFNWQEHVVLSDEPIDPQDFLE